MRCLRVTSVTALAVLVASCAEQQNDPMAVEALVLFSQHAESRNFGTHATGAEEVPSNDSRAQGQAIFKLSKDGTELSYRLIVANIENVTQAHIHLAPAGQNGVVVLWLYPSGPPAQPIPGRSQGVLAEGVVTGADLVGALAGEPLSALIEAMRSGNAYVNVHTSQIPAGEIRGQIR